jgi:nucleotide-binding universal stress UspA family protein
VQIAASEEFLNRIFIPKASEGGATVTATLLHSESDGSNAIGAAICDFMDKHKPAAVLLMKQNKSAVCRLFVGSVTKYCASHCHAPVIIVPV